MEKLRAGDPDQIGGYDIVARLGSGGMGVVFLGSRGDQRVAIKVVRNSYLDDPSLRTRFIREVETLKRISSPYVARFLDASIDDEVAWHAVEFVNGPTLRELVDSSGPLGLGAWLKLANQLRDALKSIHDLGIVHRDLKPSNIVMSETGPKLIDFGISQDSEATSLTSTGLVAGSPAWLAPEQLDGKASTPASDLFSLGAVLTFAASGKSPWGDEKSEPVSTIYQRILSGKANLAALASEQKTVVEALLQPIPEKRTFEPDLGDESQIPSGAEYERGSNGSSAGKPKTKVGVLVGLASAVALVASSFVFLSGEPEEEVTEVSASAETVELVEAAPSVPRPKVCAISDESGWSDGSFNSEVYQALDDGARDFGVEISHVESLSSQDYRPGLDSLANSGCELIFGVGFNLVEDINASAAAHPDTHFVSLDGWSEGHENLKPVYFADYEASYLAGYVAASYSTTKVIGTFGGMQIDVVTAFMTGFYNGAMAYGSETGTPVKVLGWNPVQQSGSFVGDFMPNSDVAYQIASEQIASGADVIFPIGGDQYGAVSNAITDRGTDSVMIGADQDLALVRPDYAEITLTSVQKRFQGPTYFIIEEYVSGAPFSDNPFWGDLGNGGSNLSPFYGFDAEIPADVKTRLDEIKAGIIDGSIDPLA